MKLYVIIMGIKHQVILTYSSLTACSFTTLASYVGLDGTVRYILLYVHRSEMAYWGRGQGGKGTKE